MRSRLHDSTETRDLVADEGREAGEEAYRWPQPNGWLMS
jgi:hypothetical protein